MELETRSAPGARTRPSAPSRSTARRSSELLELARWAPNHHLTNPWRFRVLGPAGARAPEGGGRARGAPPSSTAPRRCRRLGALSGDDPVGDEEDLLATGVAAYIVLLGAARRAGSPATGARPRSCASPAGARRWACPTTSTLIGLLHLGPRAPGAARSRSARRSPTSSAGWTDAGDGPAAALDELRRCQREHAARRPRCRPDLLVAEQVLVDQRLQRRRVPEGGTPPIAKPVALAHEVRVGPLGARAAASSTVFAPLHSTSTGSPSRTNTSDLTICPTSQPIAAAASCAVRVTLRVLARRRPKASDAVTPLMPLRSAPARRSPRRSAGSGRRRCCRPP